MKQQNKELIRTKGGSSRKHNKNKGSLGNNGVMDGVSVEVDLAKIGTMHKTTVD